MKKTIKELEKLLERESRIKRICAELNNFVELKPTLLTVIQNIKELTDCEAISVRLHDDGDYPYYVYNGFPETFIERENSLCSRGENGKRISCEDGSGFMLECMCGNIIRGRFDNSLPFFTGKGSFWSNGTSKLLAGTTEEDRQCRTRNYCNSCGYESVALIPIKSGDNIIGLVQLNDKRTGMFTEDLIEYLEMVGEQIGLAIQNSLTYTKLQRALEEVKTLKGFLPICSYCKKVRDDDGYWEQIEEFIRRYSDAEFSHGICPDCVEEHYPKMCRN
ncbi:GAF domain-containing protein [candidate division KSB1 bacterium]